MLYFLNQFYMSLSEVITFSLQKFLLGSLSLEFDFASASFMEMKRERDGRYANQTFNFHADIGFTS